MVECDLCKKEIARDMDVFEIKRGNSGRQEPTEAYGAAICSGCWKALGAGEFVHKFKSMGALDLAPRQRAAVQTDLNGPVPVDPRVAQMVQGGSFGH